MPTLDSLTPNRRTQYEALIPEIQRSVREAQNGRGTFYSGDAVDAEARAKSDLLAKLAGQDASEQATASENAKNRDLESRLNAEQVKTGKRNALLGLIGGGVGSAATLGGLAMMHPNGGNNILPMADGRIFSIDASGKATQIVLPGTAAPGVGGATLAHAAAPGGTAFNPGGWNDPNLIPGNALGGGAPTAVGAAGATGAAGVASSPSMWKSAVSLPNLGAGALGGGLGYLGARAAGASGTGADVGAGVGGAGGYLAGLKYGAGNPLAAGLGALAGTFGGGMLGNLFK